MLEQIKKIQVIGRINKETGKEIESPKQYLALLYFESNYENDDKTFEIIDGKENAFRYLLDMIVNESNVDLIKSMIMSESVPLNKSISLYSFMRLLLNDKKYSDIAINDYDFTLDILNDGTSFVYGYNDAKDLDDFYNKEINQELD